MVGNGDVHEVLLYEVRSTGRRAELTRRKSERAGERWGGKIKGKVGTIACFENVARVGRGETADATWAVQRSAFAGGVD